VISFLSSGNLVPATTLYYGEIWVAWKAWRGFPQEVRLTYGR
jgi:hypothetical protein